MSACAGCGNYGGLGLVGISPAVLRTKQLLAQSGKTITQAANDGSLLQMAQAAQAEQKPPAVYYAIGAAALLVAGYFVYKAVA